MVQSPRGQINVTAPIGFPIETVETYMNPDQNITSSPTQNIHNTDSPDQLVWPNPIHTNLHPQILRQIAFSDNLLHMVQSAKTPLGVNPFWEQGATPPIEWKQWFSTLKMAIMARDSIEVHKLLKLKPQPTDLFYPTLPTYEEEFEGETEDEARNREQRNERRRKCTTNELVHELNITFTIPRNTTFDRFNFFKSMQQTHESLETFLVESEKPEQCANSKT